MKSIKKDLLTIKLKLDNPTSTQPRENYADKVKTNRNETQTKCTIDIRSGTRQNRDPCNTLLIKQIRNSEIVSKSKKRLLPFIQTKNTIRFYCSTW